MLEPHRPTRSLRSANKALLKVPATQLASMGDRAFSVRAPKLWNALPEALRHITLLSSFKSQLKTHLFTMAFI